MRAYFLCRHEDVSGTSGTGRVAQVAEFDDGTAVVRWIASLNTVGVASTTVFQSIEDLLKVHGHEGRTGLDLLLDSGRVAELEAEVERLRGELAAARCALREAGVRE
jgi:hypothetical protein